MLLADEREVNIDFMIALDISKSMEDKLQVVKDYVINDIIGELVKIGDYLLIISFYGYTDEVASFVIESETDIIDAQQTVSQIIDTKPYTDIGNALDVLKLHADAQAGSGRDKFLILITDGEQYTHPESKYYSPDGSINHAMLENARTIAQEGWKIEVLDFSTSETTKNITEELSGTHTEVTTEGLTETELERGRIDANYSSEKIIIGQGGKGKILLTLTSQEYKEEQEIIIRDILLTIDSLTEKSVLDKQIEFTIQAEETKDLIIPIKLPADIKAGDYYGEVVFKFTSQVQFLPARQELSLHINSFIENYPWIIPVAIVLGILTILILFLVVRKLIKGRVTKFRLIVEKKSLKRIYTIKRGQKLFLNENFNTINIAPKKSKYSIAELMGTKGGIQLTVIKAEQLPSIKKAKANVLNDKITIFTENDREIHIQFSII